MRYETQKEKGEIMLNQKGHGDYYGLMWLFFTVALIVIGAECALVAVTIIFWKYMWVRIVFGIASVLGLIFIIKMALDIWR